MIKGSGQLLPTSTDADPEVLMEEWGAQVILPVLPISSHLRHKASGRIYYWLRQFAERSDVFENCDEHGNTAVSAWSGTQPPGWNEPVIPPPVATPKNFRPVGNIGLDVQTSPMAQHLPDLTVNMVPADRRESALPAPAVANLSMDELMASLQNQVKARYDAAQ